MGAPSYGKRKGVRKAVGFSLTGKKRSIGKLFLDSGAHSLYHEHTLNKPKAERYDWYVRDGKITKDFRNYLTRYATFVQEHSSGFDLYVTVDAIYNPDVSWLAYELLVKLGLKPVPVIHHRTALEWVSRYLDRGCRLLGIGGLGQESTRASYTEWADRLFRMICPAPHFRPVVKTHGFAMTSYPLIVRYPWWSVDSTSWAKPAGFGSIFVPHKRDGKFTFEETPYVIGISSASSAASIKGRHYSTLSRSERQIVLDWLETIGLALGRVNAKGETLEYGVASEYHARAVANLKFFQIMAKSFDVSREFRKSVRVSAFDSIPKIDKRDPLPKGVEHMHLFFSGGSPIVETALDKPDVMLSAFVNARNWKPDARFRRLMKLVKSRKRR